MKNSAVIICRASTRKQKNSIEIQEALCRDFCERSGLVVVAVFHEVISGGSLERPVLDEAVSMALSNDAVLVATKVCRLSRRISRIGDIIDRGVRVRLVQLGSQDVNKLILGVLAAMAESERDLIRQRTREALRHLKNQGVSLGNPKWEKSISAARKSNANRGYEHREMIINHIRELRALGVSNQSDIASALNVRGVTTRRGGKWTQGNVSRILKAA